MIPLKDMVLTSADEAAKVITTLAPGIGIALATTFVGIGLSLLRDEDK
jgi:biopolymer transport protein ExbB/TolQ